MSPGYISFVQLIICVSLVESFNTYEYPSVVNVYNHALSAFLIPNELFWRSNETKNDEKTLESTRWY